MNGWVLMGESNGNSFTLPIDLEDGDYDIAANCQDIGYPGLRLNCVTTSVTGRRLICIHGLAVHRGTTG